MPTIPFPNVPNVPGVPPLVRSLAGGAATAVALTRFGLATAVPTLTKDNQWGIFSSLSLPSAVTKTLASVQNAIGAVNSVTRALNSLGANLPVIGSVGTPGVPVLTGDSVVGFEFSKENRISDYPVEGGGFESFNKVEVPYDARIVFLQGGSESERAAFLERAAALAASIDRYTVVTPEITYPNANVVGFSYRRSAENGVTLLTVEVMVRQVRTSVKAAYTSTRTAAGAEDVNAGPVQAVPPTTAQAGAIGAG